MKIKYLSFLVLLGVVVAVLYNFGIFKKSSGPYFGNVINKFCVNDKCYQVDDAGLNTEVIKATLEKWQTMKLTDVISTNKNKFAEMGIAETDKVILEINGKKLEIGAVSGDYTGTMVRIPNDNKIYKLNVIMDRNHINDPNYWMLTRELK